MLSVHVSDSGNILAKPLVNGMDNLPFQYYYTQMHAPQSPCSPQLKNNNSHNTHNIKIPLTTFFKFNQLHQTHTKSPYHQATNIKVSYRNKTNIPLSNKQKATHVLVIKNLEFDLTGFPSVTKFDAKAFTSCGLSSVV